MAWSYCFFVLRLFMIITYLSIHKIQCQKCSPNIPYRVEVELIRFEDFGGIKHDGRKCDTFFGSKCDPMIYATIRSDDYVPSYLSGPADGTQGLSLVIYTHNSNIFDINRVIQKNVCETSSNIFKIFARVIDYDLMKTDLIEDFNCAVNTTISTRLLEPIDWSEVTDCQSRYQPGKIKLSYRWRTVAIPKSDCEPVTLKPNGNYYDATRPSTRLIGTTRWRSYFKSKNQLNKDSAVSADENQADYTVLSGRKR